MKKFILLVLLCSVFFSQAQSEAYSKNMKAFLETTGSINYYDNVVDKLFNLLQEKYANQNVPQAT